MRQLFVPACLCVMTFSNTTGFDLPIDKFAGSPSFDKKVLMRESSSPTADAREEPARQGSGSGRRVDFRRRGSAGDLTVRPPTLPQRCGPP